MIGQKLELIRESILDKIPLFGGVNGYIIKRGVDQRVKGITDTIDNYFYLDYRDGDGQMTFNDDDSLTKDSVSLETNYKLIARFSGVSVDDGLSALIACLKPMINVEIESATTDAEFIFSEENDDDKLKRNNMCLVRIYFTTYEHLRFNINCIDLNCTSC